MIILCQMRFFYGLQYCNKNNIILTITTKSLIKFYKCTNIVVVSLTTNYFYLYYLQYSNMNVNKIDVGLINTLVVLLVIKNVESYLHFIPFGHKCSICEVIMLQERYIDSFTHSHIFYLD